MKRHNLKLLPSDTEIVGDVPQEVFWKELHEKEYALDTPPEGAVTALQYSKINGCSRPTAVCLLDKLVRHGKLESKIYPVYVEGRRREAKHYWPKKA